MKDNPEKNIIHAVFNRKTFVKVKQCLEIGKVLFSFVNMEQPDKHVDCYMSAEEFGAILMASIKNTTLLKKIADEKKRAQDAGEQYPKNVWTSPIGGLANGPNGKPISRFFSIAPGASAEVILTATMYPATISSTGAFIKVKDSDPLEKIQVGFTYNDLRLMQYKWAFLEEDYMKKKYCVENMKSDWHPQESEVGIETNQEQEQEQGQNQSQEQLQPESNTVLIDCVTQGNIIEHPNQNGGMLSTDILIGTNKAKLWIKKNGGLTIEPGKRYIISAEKKGTDYLLVSLAG